MKGFKSFPEAIRFFLAAVGWGDVLMFSQKPLSFAASAFPAAFVHLDWLVWSSATTVALLAAFAPLAWWCAKALSSIGDRAVPWRYGRAQSFRIVGAFLTALAPALLWYIVHPVMLWLHLLAREDALQEWILFGFGLALLFGARRLTDLVFDGA